MKNIFPKIMSHDIDSESVKGFTEFRIYVGKSIVLSYIRAINESDEKLANNLFDACLDMARVERSLLTNIFVKAVK